jgi:hypothetical protein
MQRMATRGYGAMFITDRVQPAHYLNLPTIWPLSIEAACMTNINQGGMNDAVGRRMLSAP